MVPGAAESVGSFSDREASSGDALARPKSRILTTPSVVRITFSGFRSRWTMPLACAAARPSAIWPAIWSAFGSGRPAAVEQVPQVRALEELHGQVGPPGLLADVVDRDDVRVVQRRGRARLGVEAGDAGRVADHVVRKDLDRDAPAEPRVLRPPDLSHSAGAQRRNHLVGTDLRALAQRHGTPGEL